MPFLAWQMSNLKRNVIIISVCDHKEYVQPSCPKVDLVILCNHMHATVIKGEVCGDREMNITCRGNRSRDSATGASQAIRSESARQPPTRPSCIVSTTNSDPLPPTSALVASHPLIASKPSDFRFSWYMRAILVSFPLTSHSTGHYQLEAWKRLKSLSIVVVFRAEWGRKEPPSNGWQRAPWGGELISFFSSPLVLMRRLIRKWAISFLCSTLVSIFDILLS